MSIIQQIADLAETGKVQTHSAFEPILKADVDTCLPKLGFPDFASASCAKVCSQNIGNVFNSDSNLSRNGLSGGKMAQLERNIKLLGSQNVKRFIDNMTYEFSEKVDEKDSKVSKRRTQII